MTRNVRDARLDEDAFYVEAKDKVERLYIAAMRRAGIPTEEFVLRCPSLTSMNLAYRYGQKLAAEPWSVLRTGLTHGAISAVPGAALGGALGYATAPKEYTREQRLSRAGKGALVGGATTGLAGGGVSALMQRDHRGMYDALGRSNDSIASIFDNFTGIGGDPSLAQTIAGSYRNATQAARENFPKTWAG